MHRLVQMGAVSLDTLVILTQQAEDRMQPVTADLMTKSIVASDDFQKLFHGRFEIVLCHFDRAQLVTCFKVIGIVSNGSLEYLDGRGRPAPCR